MATVLIMNNADSFRALPPPHIRRKPDAEKKLKALQSHVLFPGLNEVGEDEWTEAKKLPVIAHLIEEKVLEEIKGKGKKAASTLSDLKPEEQIKMVKETTNADLLQSWKDGAPANVAKAIADRIDELKADPKNGKK